MGDAELHGHHFQREPRRVQVQNIAFAPPEFRIGEVSVGVDRGRPLKIVEHFTTRH